MDQHVANLEYLRKVSKKEKRGIVYHDDMHESYSRKTAKKRESKSKNGKYKNHR